MIRLLVITLLCFASSEMKQKGYQNETNHPLLNGNIHDRKDTKNHKKENR